MTDDGKLTGLEEYVSRMKAEQNDIYYLHAPSRASIEAGPYLEAFKKRGLEVVYFTEPVDEYVLASLTEFSGKKLVSADSAGVDLGDAPETEAKDGLTESEAEEFSAWMKDSLGESVEKVVPSKRLVDSPVAALLPEGGRMGPQLRAMMKTMKQEAPPVKVQLDINPKHPLIVKLARSRSDRPEASKLIAGQLLDTALLSAGLVEDPRSVVGRLNKVLELALEK
jgi:molecular chaperone HtpG